MKTDELFSLAEQEVANVYGGYPVFVPSARLGIMCTCLELLEPGDGIAIASTCCESAIFPILAAGMIPVFVDINPETGNIDYEALENSHLPEVRAVMTTNLYGVPDDLPSLATLCQKRDWTLIEDCAQVLDSYVCDRPVGSFGQAAIFSFPKFLDEQGGAIVCRNPNIAERIRRRVSMHVRNPPVWVVWTRQVQSLIERSTGHIGQILKKRIAAARVRLRKAGGNLPTLGRRMTLKHQNKHLPTCAKDRIQELAPLQGYLAPTYDELPPPYFVERLIRKLCSIDQIRTRVRRDNDRLLANCPLACPTLPGELDVCYLRVPFLVTRREELRQAILDETGISTNFIYDPPLPDYLPDKWFLDRRLYPNRDANWCATVFPIPGALAQTYCDTLSAIGKQNI